MNKYAALKMMNETQSVASLITGGAKMADTVHVPGAGTMQVNFAPEHEQKVGPDGTVEMRANPLDQMKAQAKAEVAQRQNAGQQSRNRLVKDFARRTGPGLSVAPANNLRAAPMPVLQRAAQQARMGRNNMRGLTTINSLTPTMNMRPAAKAITKPIAKPAQQPVANVNAILASRMPTVRRMAVGLMHGGLAEAQRRLGISMPAPMYG